MPIVIRFITGPFRWFEYLGACMVLVLILGAVSACGSIAASKNSQYETKVFAASADYNAVLSVAVTYESQPRCADGQSRLTCSDRKIVAILRQADTTASAALKAAEDTVRTPGATDSNMALALTAAVNAVSALRTILTTYGILK